VPLVFVHGVNTRSTDPDYVRGVAARRTMFEEIVVPGIVQKGFPAFRVADDIYWGDLGVAFGWNLRAVPSTKLIASLGVDGKTTGNLDLLQLVEDTRSTTPAGVQTLGGASPIAVVAEKNPAGLVRSIFAMESERFAARELQPPSDKQSDSDNEKMMAQGEQLGLLLIAVDQLASELEKPENSGLIRGTSDAMVLEKIEKEVTDRYQKLAQPRLDAAASDVQHLGGSNPISWTLGHLKSTLKTAKDAVTGAAAEIGRGVSLVALKAERDTLSQKGLRFLGDVFVYLHHGRTASPSIYERVKKGVLSLNGRTNAAGIREPYIIVTHSFGSEILYDLIISKALDDVTFDLWVTVGAQTSLFAEMSLFADMPLPLPHDTSTYELGRPDNVKKWLNVYDAADVLSYLHEPVFGEAAVKDVQVRAKANLTNAHGHYFVDPGFYELVAAEL
jgi:hypothetical protein